MFLVAQNGLARGLGIDWAELRQAYSTFLRDPAVGIHHIIQAGRESGWQRWVEARWCRQAQDLEGATIQIDLQQLAALPPDTLGGAYARHMLQMGFDPDTFVSQDSQDWIGRRAALAHDVHHVIVGFDASPVGEFGLAAYCLVQFWDLLNVFVLSFVPITLIGYPRQIFRLMRAISRGLWLGLISKPIMAYPFESNWQTPLQQVRQELRLV
jgi:ubiquinone biosynthesis protein Coq4